MLKITDHADKRIFSFIYSLFFLDTTCNQWCLCMRQCQYLVLQSLFHWRRIQTRTYSLGKWNKIKRFILCNSPKWINNKKKWWFNTFIIVSLISTNAHERPLSWMGTMEEKWMCEEESSFFSMEYMNPISGQSQEVRFQIGINNVVLR